VVSDEIRRLAETSAEQSRAITAELSQVQSAIQEVVTSSADSEHAFDQVGAKIMEVDTLVREIRQAMNEQQEGSKQILEALRSMNEITSQVRDGSAEMSSGTSTLLEEMVKLRSSSSEIEERMHEVSQASTEIGDSAERVAQMAEGTGKTIEDMEKVIGRFTGERRRGPPASSVPPAAPWPPVAPTLSPHGNPYVELPGRNYPGLPVSWTEAESRMSSDEAPIMTRSSRSLRRTPCPGSGRRADPWRS
jgi:methyl-accepting chemotaxis protein